MKKQSYTKEFKIGAVKMALEQHIKPGKVARDMGVSPASLFKWIADYKKHGGGAFPGKGFLAPADEELNRLRKELRQVTMERDLLKKTIVFFAEHDKKNSKP